ncbi:cpeT-like protein (nucleomorph) [Chroomonas mesostigmatica CCMP1168]|uniref:CpeT-like protein n=1 Tax=Chroomonas mesostigmatica CCMP1168 TaxID=1195612 RepID=J7GAJ3_9CRYP|nr:cpeT-like protein [Chroomonas mesostigmatica CCMP1168]
MIFFLNCFKASHLVFRKNFSPKKKLVMSSHLNKFIDYISGEWSNKEQASKFPSLWSRIQVCYRPLDVNFLKGHSFYVESAYDYSLDQPYKNGVLLVEEKDDILELCNFKIIGSEDFWYGAYDPTLLKDLTVDRLIKLPIECNTEFQYDTEKDLFIGKTKPGKKCIIPRKNNTTFLDSTFLLEKNKYSSLDIGRDVETEAQIWGSTEGPFRFDRVKKF